MMRIGGDRMWIDRGGSPDAANAIRRRRSVESIDAKWMMGARVSRGRAMGEDDATDDWMGRSPMDNRFPPSPAPR